MRNNYPCRGNSRPRGRRDERFGELMLLNNNVRVESGKRNFRKIKRGLIIKSLTGILKNLGFILSGMKQ